MSFGRRPRRAYRQLGHLCERNTLEGRDNAQRSSEAPFWSMPFGLVGDSLMARIAYPDPASQSHDVLDRLQRTGSLNVNRMMSHAEGPMLAYSRLGVQLLLRAS